MNGTEPCFACDAMLGGLARWLRAAGYDASWHEGVADPDLVRLAQQQGRLLLTSDIGITHYAVIRDGRLPALWIPHRLRIREQLSFVLGKLSLPLRSPRCMACGGQLNEVAKEHVRDRVPPRSYAWQERFWQCSSCQQVFWHGTHWARIEAQLRQAVPG
jgi:uncharacterized protein with PIN domain